MPLIIVTGFPSSGKTTRVNEIKEYLQKKIQEEKKQLRVHVIDDGSLHVTKDAYKGYRYQMYCVARAIGTPSCCVHMGTPVEVAKDWNTSRGEEGYDGQIFDELVSRYEEPDERNKWESPLFTIIYDDKELPLDKIWDALINKQAKPPNKSTVSKPVSATNYVYELDKATLEIINAFVERQKELGPGGMPMTVPRSETKVVNPPRTVTLSELRRLRKQFINFNKLNTTIDVDRLGDVFVTFLNSSLE
ncbi:chromatin associated protein KTI12-domain-containing protein [Mycotypha africana]|uniref:chromatin associated protein KTI12-domain-containing protein n=1 Tax=Mycotypha africana TaxID=64632 RepID=UPI00230111B8|nr:chromatin associated protein KTI12-domain-containing protein [Mycotypha africana]KAI8967629.1 chromatin associated protein KTI12-domain-containing protein [Mycotypha africana]